MKIQLVILPSGPILVHLSEGDIFDVVMSPNKVIAGVEGLPSVVFSPSSCLHFPVVGQVFDVEVEMELKEPYRDKYGDMRMNEYTPKVINNTIKVTKIL